MVESVSKLIVMLENTKGGSDLATCVWSGCAAHLQIVCVCVTDEVAGDCTMLLLVATTAASATSAATPATTTPIETTAAATRMGTHH